MFCCITERKTLLTPCSCDDLCHDAVCVDAAALRPLMKQSNYLLMIHAECDEVIDDVNFHTS